ncbi:MAG: hypothetical protein JW832_16015 [Deltaproteobacteria bacterium]|nr:hypothetical protein [Deltaproteobacteria bacterium]
MNRKCMIFFLAVIVLSTANISHAEPASAFNVQVLLPGMTKIIELEQQQTLPLGCPQFFIFTVGSGILGISVKKDDVAGDTIFMTGYVSTGGRLIPLRRIGSSTGMIDQIVELEGSSTALGFAWIWCGVAASQNIPLYSSQLRLSLQP